jgi:hypothetical protein
MQWIKEERNNMDPLMKEKTLEEKIDDINHLDGISLEDTIELMKSDDYKERFVAEYLQTKIRYNNLHRMIVKMEAGTLEFTPDTSILILKNQKSFMGQYLNQLEIRAEIEGIPLPRI